MGGIGSGRAASFGLMVEKCHEMHSIDLAWLRRKKLLKPGQWSSLRWSRGGHETGSIRIACVQEGMLLSYRQRERGGEWQDVSEIVSLVETTTRFGGRRQWFLCLSCRRRCRILYGGAYFRCRRCMNLKYDTQYEPAFARAATRALKIRERLGGKGGIDDPFPEKPKGMRWATYERLRDEEERLQRAWAVGVMGRFRIGDGET
jgi:hypothetical protein